MEEKARKKERMIAMLEKQPGERCETCQCFHEHYVYDRNQRKYSRIWEGHCETPRLKRRKAYDICEHYSKKLEE